MLTTDEAIDLENDTAARIVAAARQYFTTHGFRSVTMDDLANELGMSKKTLYQHFPAKTALLTTVLEAKMAQAEASMSEIVAREGLDFAGRLHEMLASIRGHTSELSPAFMRDVARDAPDLFATLQNRRRELIQKYWAILLEEGRNQNMIRRDLSLDLMIAVLIGAADSVVNPQKLEELGMTPREAFIEIISLFTSGAATEKGRLRL